MANNILQQQRFRC